VSCIYGLRRSDWLWKYDYIFKTWDVKVKRW
jgi:hypothetical protein